MQDPQKEIQNEQKPVKEKKERKANAKKPVKTKFPTEGKLNKYGFIYLDTDVLAAWGLSKGTEQKLSIDLEDGALTVRKA